jgi:hypothetical protein
LSSTRTKKTSASNELFRFGHDGVSSRRVLMHSFLDAVFS